MDSQFISINAYNVSKARSIVSEAMRVKSYCKHVLNPIAPNVVFCDGFSPFDMPRLLRHLIKYSNAKTMHKLPKNRLVFCAGVVSYPKTPLFIESSQKEQLEYLKWKHLNNQFFDKEFGCDFMGTIEHLDERYAHLHYYVMPKLENSGKIALKAHPGRNFNLANQNESGSFKRKGYIQAMKDFLQRYYEQVGRLMGWSIRSSTPRKRVSREKWEDELKQISDKKILQMLGYNFDIPKKEEEEVIKDEPVKRKGNVTFALKPA